MSARRYSAASILANGRGTRFISYVTNGVHYLTWGRGRVEENPRPCVPVLGFASHTPLRQKSCFEASTVLIVTDLGRQERPSRRAMIAYYHKERSFQTRHSNITTQIVATTKTFVTDVLTTESRPPLATYKRTFFRSDKLRRHCQRSGFQFSLAGQISSRGTGRDFKAGPLHRQRSLLIPGYDISIAKEILCRVSMCGQTTWPRP